MATCLCVCIYVFTCVHGCFGAASTELLLGYALLPSTPHAEAAQSFTRGLGRRRRVRWMHPPMSWVGLFWLDSRCSGAGLNSDEHCIRTERSLAGPWRVSSGLYLVAQEMHQERQRRCKLGGKSNDPVRKDSSQSEAGQMPLARKGPRGFKSPCYSRSAARRARWSVVGDGADRLGAPSDSTMRTARRGQPSHVP
jgi:hypothetical protein